MVDNNHVHTSSATVQKQHQNVHPLVFSDFLKQYIHIQYTFCEHILSCTWAKFMIGLTLLDERKSNAMYGIDATSTCNG